MKMEITTDIDMTCWCKKFRTALNRFFKKYPQYKEDWEETFQWMYENNVDFFCDNIMGNGEHNDDWCYALHLDVNENNFCIAIVLRDYKKEC